MTVIYLVRHCQSFANARREYNSRIDQDEGLNDIGKEQAALVAKFFRGIKIGKIYSSPFKRTSQTADAIASVTGSTIEYEDKFGELNCGQWDGKTEGQIRERYPEAWKGWRYDPQNNPIPGGETILELQTRVLPEFQKIVKKHENEKIILVTHYCVFNVIICALVSSLSNFRCFDTTNGTIAEISMENVPRIKVYYSPVAVNGSHP